MFVLPIVFPRTTASLRSYCRCMWQFSSLIKVATRQPIYSMCYCWHEDCCCPYLKYVIVVKRWIKGLRMNNLTRIDLILPFFAVFLYEPWFIKSFQFGLFNFLYDVRFMAKLSKTAFLVFALPYKENRCYWFEMARVQMSSLTPIEINELTHPD